MRVAIVDSHPIQYHVPFYRALSALCELEVLYAHAQTATGQGQAGYGVAFEWDVDLTTGYTHRFLRNVARKPSVGSFGGCDTPELLREARHYDALITTGWYLKCFWQAALGCRAHRVPVLVRGDSQLNADEPLRKRLTRRATHSAVLRVFDGFLSVGARNRAYLRAHGVSEERIFFSPHVVDVARFRASASLTADERTALRAKAGAGPGDCLVLQVGRLIDFKRPLDTITAIASLGDEGKRFVAAYAGAGALEQAIRTTADQLGVRARLLGFCNQSTLPAWYAAADLLVLASDARETWGLVVNEAFACGLPAIVSDAAGCAPDLIADGLTGARFAAGDCAGLARALLACAELRARADTQLRLHELSDARSPEQAARLTLGAIETVMARKERA